MRRSHLFLLGLAVALCACATRRPPTNGADAGHGTDAGHGNDAFVTPQGDGGGNDAYVPPSIDAGHDAFVAPGIDAGHDAAIALPDAGSDAGHDAGNDAARADAGPIGLCSTLVISEIRSRGLGGASDEFVELYNPTGSTITLDSSWTLSARSSTSTSYSSRWVGAGGTIAAHGYYVIAGSGYTQTPAADAMLSTGITDASSVRLQHAMVSVDALCFGFDATTLGVYATDTTYECEGTAVDNSPHNNAAAGNFDQSLARTTSGASCGDTNDNTSDFQPLMPATPGS